MLGSILGTAIGGLFGRGAGKAVATAVGGELGARADDRRDARIAAQRDADYYKNLATNAKAGGFHPLEALRAGGGAGYPTGRSPVGSSVARAGMHDQFLDAITGDAAQRRRNLTLQNDLLKVQADELRRGRIGAAAVAEPEIDPDAPVGNIWSDGYIRLKVGWTDEGIKFPKTIADRIGIENGQALLASDLEEIAGDEISQVMFADWLASQGMDIRGFDVAKQQGQLETFIEGVWDEISGKRVREKRANESRPVQGPPMPQTPVTLPEYKRHPLGWREVNPYE